MRAAAGRCADVGETRGDVIQQRCLPITKLGDSNQGNRMSFSEFWKALQQNLCPGDEVRNWTQFRGYLGDTFEVVSINTDHVIVKAPKAKTAQRARDADFQLVFNKWPQYISGQFPRTQLLKDTRVSKYTISIIRHLTDDAGSSK